VKSSAAREPNPYDSPAELEPRRAPSRSVRNRASFAAFLLSLIPPVGVLFSPVILVFNPSLPDFLPSFRLLLFVTSPAAIFAVAFSIIGLYGRPNQYSMVSLLLGGAECLAIVVFLLLTV
jgi:hypothetical protein